jgi:nucleoside 2-deoxyribosyltransferase
MIITIVGSMKFYEEYEKIKKILESKRHKVIIPLKDEVYSKEINIKRKAMEDFNNNLKKSDAILVANFDKNNKKNHIGINSIMEVGMAFNRKKKVYILNQIPEECKEEFEAIECVTLNGNLDNLK